MRHSGVLADSLMATQPRRGMSLMELLAAAVIGSLMAGGTLLAFVTAMRIRHPNRVNADQMQLLYYEVERLRNRIACDQWSWFNPVCRGRRDIPTEQDNSPLPLKLRDSPDVAGVVREVIAQPQDCTGDGIDDCMKVTARLVQGAAP